MSLPQKWFQEYAVLSSPAKVNLRLKVTGRRADGYHLLSMINVSCSLSDTVRIRMTETLTTSVTMHSRLPGNVATVLPGQDDNLASRAVQKFCQVFGFSFGADIEITKVIPLGGGLGGGSGNAAAILAFLGRECGVLDDPRLHQIALTLGTDVPYMMPGGLAWVGSVGEDIHLISAPELRDYPMALIFPPFGIETARIFSRLRERAVENFTADAAIERIGQGGKDLPAANLLPLIENDLFDFATAEQPQLREIVGALAFDRTWRVSMSGTGSTLFVIPAVRMEAEQLAVRVRDALTGSGALVQGVEMITQQRDRF